MKFLGMVLVVWGLAGCATKPTVYLYARYLPQEKVAELTHAFENQQLNVKVNRFNPPTRVSSNTLLYSLLLQDVNTIGQVSDIVARHGYDIKYEQALEAGNHWYTKNSLALFLFPADHHRIVKVDLVGHYELSGCDGKMNMQLSADGSFTLTGQDAKGLRATMKHGTWHYRQHPVVELRPQEGESAYSYFMLSYNQTQDQISPLTYTYLTPLQARFVGDGCTFITAIRHQL